MDEDEAMSLFESELSSPPEGDPEEIWAASLDLCGTVREAVGDDHAMKLDDEAVLEAVRATYGAKSSDALIFRDALKGTTNLVILGQDAPEFIHISRQWLCPDTLA